MPMYETASPIHAQALFDDRPDERRRQDRGQRGLRLEEHEELRARVRGPASA
jgi:hypothetical protein